MGAHLKLVLGLFGFGLDSVSFRFGFVLGSVSIPLGFILDSISIRCVVIVSDVWDSISVIWNQNSGLDLDAVAIRIRFDLVQPSKVVIRFGCDSIRLV